MVQMLFDVINHLLIHQIQALEPRSTASLLLGTSRLLTRLRLVRHLRVLRSHRLLARSWSNRVAVNLLVLRLVFRFLYFLLLFCNLLLRDLQLRVLHDALAEIHALLKHGADVLDLRVRHFECKD